MYWYAMLLCILLGSPRIQANTIPISRALNKTMPLGDRSDVKCLKRGNEEMTQEEIQEQVQYEESAEYQAYVEDCFQHEGEEETGDNTAY